MNRILKFLLSGMMLGASALAIAQSTTSEEGIDRDAAGDPALPCVSSGDAILPSGVHGPPEPGAVPCEEPEALPDEEQTTGDDVTADEVFTPDDEILEDYPIPLPADM